MPKLIHDTIHGMIELDDLSLKIINTPEFQRLRNIKQLSTVYYVFPGATHSRFEHSLGVSHLAGEFLSSLRDRQPELEISDIDLQNIKIAGLCHDLGHGPFSHTFDIILEKLSDPNKVHEIRSGNLLRIMNKKYVLNIEEENLEKIIDLIHPVKLTLNKKFMYQIVANNVNGLDVDKYDYLKRDTYYLGLTYNCDYSRIFKYAKVISDNICYPKKILPDLCEIYYTRLRLHRQVYNHPVCKSIEFMIQDILQEIIAPYYDSKILNLKNNIDLIEFSKLDDNIINLVYLLFPHSNSLKIIERLNMRQLYKYKGKVKTIVFDKPNHIYQELKLGISKDLIKNITFYDSKNNIVILNDDDFDNCNIKFGFTTEYRLFYRG